MPDNLLQGLVNVAISQLPSILSFVRELHAKAQPGDPPPTNDEVLAALAEAVASSIARDDRWLAAHPE